MFRQQLEREYKASLTLLRGALRRSWAPDIIYIHVFNTPRSMWFATKIFKVKNHIDLPLKCVYLLNTLQSYGLYNSDVIIQLSKFCGEYIHLWVDILRIPWFWGCTYHLHFVLYDDQC